VFCNGSILLVMHILILGGRDDQRYVIYGRYLHQQNTTRATQLNVLAKRFTRKSI